MFMSSRVSGLLASHGTRLIVCFRISVDRFRQKQGIIRQVEIQVFVGQLPMVVEGIFPCVPFCFRSSAVRLRIRTIRVKASRVNIYQDGGLGVRFYTFGRLFPSYGSFSRDQFLSEGNFFLGLLYGSK